MKGAFNGKTWIVALMAIFCLTSLGMYAEIQMFMILKSTNDVKDTMIDLAVIAYIPKTTIEGITATIKRLTYVPKQEDSDEK